MVPARVLPLFLVAALTLYANHFKILPEKGELMELFLGTAFAVMALQSCEQPDANNN